MVCLPSSFSYIADGDVLRVGNEDVAVLFQKAAKHHTFLLTERCNHHCLMCSQPPKDVSDGWIVEDVLASIPLLDRLTSQIVLTGGEPTLLGTRLMDLVKRCQSYLPETGVHILTNGRSFVHEKVARDFARIEHQDLMFGIPIYSDLSERHDHVVQADGAFDETIRGILDLKAERIESRDPHRNS